MHNIIIWTTICVISIVWGLIHYKAKYYAGIDKHNKYFKFLEFLRVAINYFITLIILYYFISMRWALISQGNYFSTADFILGMIFLVGVFGWLPYFVRNVTEGINAILKRILDK